MAYGMRNGSNFVFFQWLSTHPPQHHSQNWPFLHRCEMPPFSHTVSIRQWITFWIFLPCSFSLPIHVSMPTYFHYRRFLPCFDVWWGLSLSLLFFFRVTVICLFFLINLSSFQLELLTISQFSKLTDRCLT